MLMKMFCVLSPLQLGNSDLGHGAEAQGVLRGLLSWLGCRKM